MVKIDSKYDPGRFAYLWNDKKPHRVYINRVYLSEQGYKYNVTTDPARCLEEGYNNFSGDVQERFLHPTFEALTAESDAIIEHLVKGYRIMLDARLLGFKKLHPEEIENDRTKPNDTT